jgi:hypothetical protein
MLMIGMGAFLLGWVHVEVVKVVGSARGIAGLSLGLILRRYEMVILEKFFPEMQPHQAHAQLRLIIASLFNGRGHRRLRGALCRAGDALGAACGFRDQPPDIQLRHQGIQRMPDPHAALKSFARQLSA